MTNSWKIGGVQLELREDGNFSIYQPDSGRVLPKELALQVADMIRLACDEDLNYPDVSGGGVPYTPQSTVPGGVIGTSEGAFDPELGALLDREGLTETEAEADKNAAEARASIERGVADVEEGRVSERVALDEMAAAGEAEGMVAPEPKPAPKRRGRPPKARP